MTPGVSLKSDKILASFQPAWWPTSAC